MQVVLITGVCGFIGMHTAIKYLKEGFEVIGVDNLNDYYDINLKKSRLNEIKNCAEIIKGEFSYIQTDIALDFWTNFTEKKIDILVHLAAQAGVRFSVENPDAYFSSNVLGFQNVINFVRSREIEIFIYASSSSVYGKSIEEPFLENLPCNQPESYYAATKKINEIIAYSYYNTYNVKSAGLRFFTVYGPFGRPDMAPALFTDAALNNRVIDLYNFGRQKRDFTYIDDVVSAIFKLSLNKNNFTSAEIYNVGSANPVNLLDFVELIERYTKKTMLISLKPAQLGDVEVTFANIDKIYKLIGFKIETSIEVGLEKYVSWYKEYYSYN